MRVTKKFRNTISDEFEDSVARFGFDDKEGQDELHQQTRQDWSPLDLRERNRGDEESKRTDQGASGVTRSGWLEKR